MLSPLCIYGGGFQFCTAYVCYELWRDDHGEKFWGLIALHTGSWFLGNYRVEIALPLSLRSIASARKSMTAYYAPAPNKRGH